MHRALTLILLTSCGKAATEDSAVAPATGTTSSITCTCACSQVFVLVTLNGAPTAPDSLTLDLGSGPQPIEAWANYTTPTATGSYNAAYCDDSCVATATLGQAELSLRCEAFLRGPQTCLCGQHADLHFAFSSSTTAR